MLMLPKSYNTETMSFTDALFTATSATCVTGLIVNKRWISYIWEKIGCPWGFLDDHQEKIHSHEAITVGHPGDRVTTGVRKKQYPRKDNVSRPFMNRQAKKQIRGPARKCHLSDTFEAAR